MKRFRLQPPRASENDIERGCLALLQLRGYFPIRIHTGTFKSADGRRWIKGADKSTPDYAAVHERFPGFLLEVKRTGEQPTPEQIQKHSELRMGYRLAVGTVDSTESLARWLAEHERKAAELWAR
jgi:hypothetical protein